MAHPFAGGQRAGGVVIGLGLDGPGFRRRTARLHNQIDAGHQAAAGATAQQLVDRAVGLLQQFQRRRALTLDHPGVVEGGHKDGAAILRHLSADLLATLGPAVVEADLAAERLHARDLDGGTVGRHHDGGVGAHELRRRRHALGMVAGREGDDAGGQLGGAETADPVVGAPEFERPGDLHRLGLQQDAAAHPFVERRALDQGGADRRRGDLAGGVEDAFIGSGAVGHESHLTRSRSSA